MGSLEATTVDHPINAVNGRATLVITTLDGTKVSGVITTDYRCPFSGENDQGKFEIQFRDLRRVDFRR